MYFSHLILRKFLMIIFIITDQKYLFSKQYYKIPNQYPKLMEDVQQQSPLHSNNIQHSQSESLPILSTTDKNTNIPATIKIQSPSLIQEYWRDFGKLENKTFIRDFCHQNNFTVRATGATKTGESFKIKQTLELSEQKPEIGHNIRITFPLKNLISQTLQLRLTNKGTILHFDNGITVIRDQRCNIYGSVEIGKQWKKSNVKLGVAILKKHLEINNRIKANSESFIWYHKIIYAYKGFRMGFVGALNIGHKELITRNILVGYHKNSLDLSIKLNNPQYQLLTNFANMREWWKQVVFTTTFRRDIYKKYGVQIVYNPSTRKTQCTWLAQYLFHKNMIKIMINNGGVATFVIKKIFNSSFCLGLGTQISFNNRKLRSKFGTSFMFNL